MDDLDDLAEDTLRLWVFPDEASAVTAAHELGAQTRHRTSNVSSAYLIGWDADAERFTTTSVEHVMAPAMGAKKLTGNLVALALTAPLLGAAGGLAYLGLTSQALQAIGRDRVEAALAHLSPGDHAILATLIEPRDLALSGATREVTIG
ncbi:hypothetical protein ET495_01690 [Xylanimonas allomyrinae]|uniref:DUF1269 domain-containing protein n=1 Tax=Xylanimonas allomyrinae TaxID=2509459 RepID=A0A4P6EVZ3_9MICO|nr:hypothetical protein [Xylanimonas allomyrinae]QAY62198.1 hypothetical protein ET495_01690 [Xylanimonas allomyrinae]